MYGGRLSIFISLSYAKPRTQQRGRDVYSLFRTILFAHIAVAFFGLAAFWVPIFARKGERVHVRAGKAFLYAAYFVGVTAFMIATLSILSPFGTHPEALPSDPADIAAAVTEIRMLEAFLAYLAIITVASVHHGVRSMQTRRDPALLKTPFHTFICAAAMLAGIAMLVMGVTTEHSIRWVFVALSPIGILIGQNALRYARRPKATPMAHWYEHIGAMIGGGIAFHTAFAVFGIQRFVEYSLEGFIGILPWITPGIIGTIATVVWQRHYRRKFGETGDAKRA